MKSACEITASRLFHNSSILTKRREVKIVYESENGMRLAHMLLQSSEKPTAVFCINDMTAIVMMQELHKKGMEVPRDISVVGFDNLKLAELSIPPLTTIDQHIYEMGSSAANILIDSYEKTIDYNYSIRLEPTLVVRDSTRRLKG